MNKEKVVTCEVRQRKRKKERHYLLAGIIVKMHGSFCRPIEFSAKQIILPNDRTAVLELAMLLKLCTFDEDDGDEGEEEDEGDIE